MIEMYDSKKDRSAACSKLLWSLWAAPKSLIAKLAVSIVRVIITALYAATTTREKKHAKQFALNIHGRQCSLGTSRRYLVLIGFYRHNVARQVVGLHGCMRGVQLFDHTSPGEGAILFSYVFAFFDTVSNVFLSNSLAAIACQMRVRKIVKRN